MQQVVAAMPHDDDAAWHAGAGLSGPSRLWWLLAFTPIDSPKYAVAVLIEQGAQASGSQRAAIDIGKALLDILHP
jgi:cell division protein FtsI/penicillin-binding protein 2